MRFWNIPLEINALIWPTPFQRSHRLARKNFGSLLSPFPGSDYQQLWDVRQSSSNNFFRQSNWLPTCRAGRVMGHWQNAKDWAFDSPTIKGCLQNQWFFHDIFPAGLWSTEARGFQRQPSVSRTRQRDGFRRFHKKIMRYERNPAKTSQMMLNGPPVSWISPVSWGAWDFLHTPWFKPRGARPCAWKRFKSVCCWAVEAKPSSRFATWSVIKLKICLFDKKVLGRFLVVTFGYFWLPIFWWFLLFEVLNCPMAPQFEGQPYPNDRQRLGERTNAEIKVDHDRISDEGDGHRTSLTTCDHRVFSSPEDNRDCLDWYYLDQTTIT